MRKNLWINRVGETKIVGGHVFTLTGLYTSDKVTVDVDGIEHIVSRTVWNNGVFRDIMKKLNPCEKKSKTVASRVSKYVNQEKTIGDYMCKVIEYNKNKVLVEVEGYEGKDWMSVSTWVRASVKGFIKRIKEKFVKIIVKVNEKIDEVKYELIPWQPVVRDGFGRFSEATANIIIGEFEQCSNIKSARAVLRKYANYCHPDKGFNTYVDNKNWNFVLHGYECVVALINVFQSAWDDDDFSWD
jgi:hypothetical protein